MPAYDDYSKEELLDLVSKMEIAFKQLVDIDSKLQNEYAIEKARFISTLEKFDERLNKLEKEVQGK